MPKFFMCLAHLRIHFYSFAGLYIKRQILEIVSLLCEFLVFVKKYGHCVD